jgi:DNA-binding YbaB/EbfC family protein
MPDIENEGPREVSVSESAEPDEEGAAELDLGELLERVEVAAEQLELSAEEAQLAVLEGSAAGGAVVIAVSGGFEPLSIHIDPSLVDPRDVAMLEDAVLAALRDVLEQVVDLQSELAGEAAEVDLSALLGSLGKLPMLGGLGLPDFGRFTNPEDLIAGLGGALGGVLSGALGGLGNSGWPPAGAEGEPIDIDTAEGGHKSSDAETGDEAGEGS